MGLGVQGFGFVGLVANGGNEVDVLQGVESSGVRGYGLMFGVRVLGLMVSDLGCVLCMAKACLNLHRLIFVFVFGPRRLPHD